MRRFTLFFVLLFMLCGNVVTWAQYTTQSLASVGTTGVTSGFSSDKKYVLQTSSQASAGGYRTYMYDLKGTIRASKTLPTGVNAVNYLWTITANGNGTYKVTNVHSGKSINIAGTSDGGTVNTTDAGSQITIEVNGSDVGFRNSSKQYIDMNSTGNYAVTWSGGVSGSRVITILEADMEELTSKTWFKPQFGGELWTWDGENSTFVSASMYPNATAPARKGTKDDELGPVYKFADAGVLTTSTNANTSDKGGIWVVGATSDVTCHLGGWAGSILVEDFATTTITYDYQLKGWEVSGLSNNENTSHATLWTNGTVNFGGGRQNFDMSDGKNQRWYIGENGKVTSVFNTVTKGGRTWDIQAVVADEAVRDEHSLIPKTLTKKVMTWGADLSGQINSIAAWYKNDQGELAPLGSSAITYDASGITITYQGMGNNYKYDVAVSGYTEGGVTYDNTSYTNGRTFYSSSVLTPSDLTAAAAGSGFFDAIVSIEEVEANISYVIHVDYPAAVPFTPTTIENGDFADNTQWYRLEFNRTPKKYSKYDKTTEQATNSTTKETTRYTAFCFVEVDGGYQIYNKAAGASKPFSSVGNKFTTTGTTFTLEKFAGTLDGYLFHVKDVDNAYIHDYNNTLAIWTDGSAKNDPGSAILFAEAALTADEMESIKLDFGELDALIARVENEGVSFGTELGQYQESTHDSFTTALNAAYVVKYKEQPTQTEIDEAATALQAQFDALVINMPATEKYYRLRVKSQDANNTNYMSAYGNVNYLNTKTGDSQNRAATTFYLTADNKLQAAYNGAYIKQNRDNLETTTNAAEALTWTIEQGTVVFGTYRVKSNEANSYLYDWTTYSRDNVRISNDPAHNRCQWTIEEVEITDAEILAFDKPLLVTLAQNNESQIEAIPIVEGAEIICPSEFGSNGYDVNQLNSIINDVLAALNSSDDVNLYKTAHSDQKRHQFITSYKNLYNDYGGIVSIPYELRSQYGTICLPINYSGPQNWKIYSCATTNGSALDLTDHAFSYNQNVPFIVEYTDRETLPTSNAPKTYQFIGYGQNGATTDQRAGCLTGVLTEGGTTVPTGSYVLSKHQGKVAFYQVAENANMKCPKYKCYFTAPVGVEQVKAFFFTNEGETTGIESVFGGEEVPEIYDLSGRRLNSLQKGVNIVNGRKVIVR